MLSAGFGTEQMVATGHAYTQKATIPAGMTFDVTIGVNSSTTINGWLAALPTHLIQTPGTLEFNLKDTDSDARLTFAPQYQRYQDRYGIYFRMEGNQGAAVEPVCVPLPSTEGVPPSTEGVPTGTDSTGGGSAGGAVNMGSDATAAPEAIGDGMVARPSGEAASPASSDDLDGSISSTVGASDSDASAGCACRAAAPRESRPMAWLLSLCLAALYWSRRRSNRSSGLS